jgi:hypothetical protein
VTPARWIVSPGWDAACIWGPVWAAGLLALVVPAGAEVGTWSWLVLVLGIDVAHVWSTLFRTYLDADWRRARPGLAWGAPAVAAVGTVSLSWAAPAWFWTGMAWLAVFHFIRQPIGFAALYRLVGGWPSRDREAQIERAALVAVTLGPIVWWHAHLPRPFVWFADGDFWPALPPIVGTVALAAAAVTLLGWAVARVWGGRSNPGGDLWVVGTALAWGGGIVWGRSDLAFTLSNVVAHGLPYVALVGVAARRSAVQRGRGPGLALVGAGWGLLVALPWTLAFLEEAAWDLLVSHEHPTLFGEADGLTGGLLRVAVGLLAVPQVTHYLLDGWIWRFPPGGENRAWALDRGGADPPAGSVTG